MRTWVLRGTVSVLALLVIAVMVVAYLLVPANRSFEYDNGVRIQLLGISHAQEDGVDVVTWDVELKNNTGGPLTLDASGTCRHGFPPRTVDGPGSPTEDGEDIKVGEALTTSWAVTCTSPESGRWWYYTLDVVDQAGEHDFRTVTFAGKAH